MNEEYIFSSTNRYSAQTIENTEENKYYTLIGYESYIDDNDIPGINENETAKIFAKKVQRSNGTIKYLIRFDKNGKMFNPVSIYGNKDLSLLENLSRNNKQFKEVNKKVFDLYGKFLQTKNTAWLYNAERESE